MSLISKFRNFDVYLKPVDDCRVKTPFGGLITLISFIVIIALFCSETWNYLSVEVVEQLFVDSTSSDMRVDIHFDITLDKIPCDFVTVDVMGSAGESQDAIEDDIFKQRLDEHGQNISGSKPEKQESSSPATNKERSGECGSCYGAIQGLRCCNTCEEVKEAYRMRGWQIGDPTKIDQCKNDVWVKKLAETKGQGCRVYGKVDVGKVGGNFHVAPGNPSTSHHSHFHDFHTLSPGTFSTSHTINHLSFGQPYPGKKFPLDGKSFESTKGGIMHQYYLKVVPTTYVYDVTGNGKEELSHQFSITRTEKDIMAGASGIPGIFVQYEFSPLMVRYEERKRSLSHFLVGLCAIIGGVYTVAALVDSFIYSSSRAMARKFQMGKAS
ncbi:endoplasmic reticulum vesicle transporter domain-containing protein [Ditylenchus destructor]|uniref:Endoplasmic reticulum-Golgi intermediate compartment protein 3 n=1 Tax=Ditylenchus destructor TaxID=166010 RepID=A0AAD4QXJ2_9BILA|nr:endoplasmic reticulum vesicle transporter domain-containing protein [Ditylenchus destructor]